MFWKKRKCRGSGQDESVLGKNGIKCCLSGAIHMLPITVPWEVNHSCLLKNYKGWTSLSATMRLWYLNKASNRLPHQQICLCRQRGTSEVVPCSPVACGTSSRSNSSSGSSSSSISSSSSRRRWINTYLFGCSIWQIAERPQTVLDQTLTGTCKMLAQSLHTTWTQMWKYT